jgi:molecular chaperone DnaJ
MATERDYYEILNIDRDADGETIKRAYRKLAMKYHPDRNPDDKEAEQRFKEASEAYEVLADPEKRKRYDQFGHAGLRGTSSHDFSHMDAGDIFSMFEDIFGGMGGMGGMGGRTDRSRSRARKGYDLETETEISLEEALSGVEREIEFTRQDTCETCDGSGAKPGSKPDTCVTCAGQGQVAQSGFGGMFRMVTTCPACEGSGQLIKDKCADCKGTGKQPCKRVISINIPPGVHEGQAVRVPGEGEPGTQGGPRGDLHVVLRIEEHELFDRQEDDLVLRMPLSFTQLALGAKVQVPTLDGEEELTIEPGTQHGHVFRMRGRGLPNLRTGRRGDLLVTTLIEVPKKLSDEQEQLLRDFAETEHNNSVLPHREGFWEKIKSYLG